MEAVKRGHQEVVTVLLQQEESVCDINLEDKNKCTALHYACSLGRVGMVKQLASHPRYRYNRENNRQNSAITAAVKAGQADCVLALCREVSVVSVYLDTTDREGRSLKEIAR